MWLGTFHFEGSVSRGDCYFLGGALVLGAVPPRAESDDALETGAETGVFAASSLGGVTTGVVDGGGGVAVLVFAASSQPTNASATTANVERHERSRAAFMETPS
jgi:hypothetical protein